MPKPSSSPSSSASRPDVPFEEALAQVENLVARMENERLPLDDLIAAYDEGTALLKICRQRLQEAEKRVELISARADGSVERTPFEADEGVTAEEGAVRSKPKG